MILSGFLPKYDMNPKWIAGIVRDHPPQARDKGCQKKQDALAEQAKLKIFWTSFEAGTSFRGPDS